MKFTLNEAQAEWGAATLTRIVEGLLTGGLALPWLMASAYADYLIDVRGITPPAEGTKTVGSIDFEKGKAAIEIDLKRAFIVSGKGAALALVGGKVAAKAAAQIGAKVSTAAGRRIATQLAKVTTSERAEKIARRTVKAASIGVRGYMAGRAVKRNVERGITLAKVLTSKDQDPESWYESQKQNGRFKGTHRMEIDPTALGNIKRRLVSRVGYLQSGWNAASKRLGTPTPSWIANKNGRGSITIDRTADRYSIRAENQVPYASMVKTQSLGEKAAKNLEDQAPAVAEKEMQKIIKK